MSVLFCDLVGFTAASESADPEEVQVRLGRALFEQMGARRRIDECDTLLAQTSRLTS